MMSFMGCKKCLSIILVSKNYLTILQQLLIHAFSTMITDLLNDPDSKIMAECKQCSDWIKWKEAIDAELDSLRKREVFSNVIPTPPRTYPVRFKWVFIQKRNENNDAMRYKTRLVIQGFT
jgi:hypothetical protein